MGDGDQPPAAKKRRVGSARVERPRGVAAQFRQTDTTDVQEVSHNYHYSCVHGQNFSSAGSKNNSKSLGVIPFRFQC